MRLMTFTAATMSEAMALVRQRLGPEAIIVSTEEEDGATRLTAAIEQPEGPASAIETDVIDVLSEALSGHGLSPILIEKILCAALPFETDEALVALASAFAMLFGFAPIAEAAPRPVLFAGPPGAGKTVSLAKLATRFVMGGQSVRLITADTVRAGAIEQLEAFARVLQLPLARAESAARLAPLAAAAKPGETVLIDTPGINPYSAGDRRELASLIAESGGEPVLVLPAGGDAIDTQEMARIFRDLGATRFIVTRLDMAPRVGSIIACAEALPLAFAEAGVAPDIASGLAAFNPVLLARLVLPEAAQPERQAHAMRGSS